MRVCIIELSQKGGMVHYASQLSNALSNVAGMKLFVILPEGADISDFNCSITIRRVPEIKKNPFRFDKLFKQILNINPDIIHITAIHMWFIPIMPILKLKKYPLFVTIHDVEPHEGDKSIFLNLISQILTKYADKIFVHGDILKNQLIYKGMSKNKVEIIPLGDILFFNKYKKYMGEEKNNILFFGRIIKYKGLEYLIKAEPLITKEIPDINIIIAGEGDFSKLEPLLLNRIKFEIINEFIPNVKVAELFQKSKIVVLPYIEASQSGIIPIAYAFKKPVVATSVGAIPEVVENGKTGIIVPPKNPEALADAIIKLLKDDDLRIRMGNNAYKKLKIDMSWDRISERTITVYKVAIEDAKKER